MIDCLRPALIDRNLRLEPLAETHREPLRTACGADSEIWTIYYTPYFGEHFDPQFDKLLTDANRVAFAVMLDDMLCGMSSYAGISTANRSLEIGTTYLTPAVRGTGINGRMKRLMLDRAFGCGINRVEFRVDIRNPRSQAAMAKLGAVREGVSRKQLITWTGHVRDSVIFSILHDEWPEHG